jgi:hypothetical protein
MEQEKINFNGTEYAIEDLTDKGKYFVMQLKNLSKQLEETKIKLDQLEVAYKSFTDLLGQEIEPSGSTEDEFVAE